MEVKVEGTPPRGADILKTLLSLLEKQEQIKIRGTIVNSETGEEVRYGDD